MKKSIDLQKVKKASMILRAINHKLRQEIMSVIDENGSSIVTDIYKKLDIEQSVVSQHLGILRRANIVVTSRVGKFIHYSVNHDRLVEVDEFVDQLLK